MLKVKRPYTPNPGDTLEVVFSKEGKAEVLLNGVQTHLFAVCPSTPPAQPPQRTEQEPVAWLCTPDENGLFGLPLSDKGCKDCFPVYRAKDLMNLYGQQLAWPCEIEAGSFDKKTLKLKMLTIDYVVSDGTHWLSKSPPAQPADPTGQAPCARHCEANAFNIVIRGLEGDIERLKAAQRNPLTIDECLRDFESWLHSQGQHAFLKAPEGSKNTFWDGRTEDRWLGWKAAHGIKEST